MVIHLVIVYGIVAAVWLLGFLAGAVYFAAGATDRYRAYDLRKQDARAAVAAVKTAAYAPVWLVFLLSGLRHLWTETRRIAQEDTQ